VCAQRHTHAVLFASHVLGVGRGPHAGVHRDGHHPVEPDRAAGVLLGAHRGQQRQERARVVGQAEDRGVGAGGECGVGGHLH